MSRDCEYINISKPQARSPGLSHDLQILRDLEIANTRTAAELGSLPLGGLPVVPKQNYVPPQSVLMPEHGQTNFENQEDEAMKLSQIVAVTAVTAGIVACESSAMTESAPHPSATTVTSADPATYLPKGETNSSHSFSPTESVEVSNVRLRSSYAQCLNAAGGATWIMQNCIEKEWDYQDARLNAVYQKLKAKLPKAQWGQLQAEQREWITDRDHSEVCKWDAATEGQAQRIAANECTLLQVASRADKLEKLLTTESGMR